MRSFQLALVTSLVSAACATDSPTGGDTLPVNCNDVANTATNPVCTTPGAMMPVGSGPSLITTDGFPAINGGFVDGSKLVIGVQIAPTTSAMNAGAVLSIDLATGSRTLVTGQLPHMTGGGVDAQGTGPAFTGGLRDLQKGPDGYYALAPHAIYKIDPATGNRTSVWDETTSPCDAGGGLVVSMFPTGFAVGSDGTAFVSISEFSGASGIGAIRGGTCSIVTFFNGPAGTSKGSGDTPAAGKFWALRFGAGAIWATLGSNKQLFRVDPTSGARSLVSASSTPNVGTGPDLATEWIDVSGDGHTAWANESMFWQVTTLDLTTGDRTAYDGPIAGPASQQQGGSVWAHPAHPWAILAMATAIVLYDPATYNANVLSY